MPMKLTAHLVAAAVSLVGLGLAAAPAYANKQINMCSCLATQNVDSCSCTKNWKISQLATHSYYGYCDVDGNGYADWSDNVYGTFKIKLSVEGRASWTDCTKMATPGDLLDAAISCTNWSISNKDSTSTVVTCTKE